MSTGLFGGIYWTVSSMAEGWPYCLFLCAPKIEDFEKKEEMQTLFRLPHHLNP